MPTTIAVTFLFTVAGTVIWGFVLEQRYNGPYALLAASEQQKRSRAIALAFWQTVWLPLAGLILLTGGSSADQRFVPYCIGVWILALPVTMLIKRMSMERRLRDYLAMDEMIQAGTFQQVFWPPALRWFRWLMSREQKRFYEEGYGEKEQGLSSKT